MTVSTAYDISWKTLEGLLTSCSQDALADHSKSFAAHPAANRSVRVPRSWTKASRIKDLVKQFRRSKSTAFMLHNQELARSKPGTTQLTAAQFSEYSVPTRVLCAILLAHSTGARENRRAVQNSNAAAAVAASNSPPPAPCTAGPDSGSHSHRQVLYGAVLGAAQLQPARGSSPGPVAACTRRRKLPNASGLPPVTHNSPIHPLDDRSSRIPRRNGTTPANLSWNASHVPAALGENMSEDMLHMAAHSIGIAPTTAAQLPPDRREEVADLQAQLATLQRETQYLTETNRQLRQQVAGLKQELADVREPSKERPMNNITHDELCHLIHVLCCPSFHALKDHRAIKQRWHAFMDLLGVPSEEIDNHTGESPQWVQEIMKQNLVEFLIWTFHPDGATELADEPYQINFTEALIDFVKALPPELKEVVGKAFGAGGTVI